jgi:hypothetical protein
MSAEFGTVFAPAALFHFEAVALTSHQLAQQSLVWQKIAGIEWATKFAANFAANFETAFRIKLAPVRARQSCWL